MTDPTRRQFIQTSSAGIAGITASSALSQDRVAGANRRIRVGLIGCGGQGAGDLRAMLRAGNVECVALCDVDDEIGHNSMIACHLGNIAFRAGRRVNWDVENERVIGDPEAQKLVSKEYRAPWKLSEQLSKR